MNQFIRLEVIQGDMKYEVMLNVDAIIAVAPNVKNTETSTCWVNTAKFSYLVNEPYEITSAKIESMGETPNERS